MRGRHGNALWNDPGDRRGIGLDLDALLHPSRAFEHPADLLVDPDLTLNEKRAILASWASDACAVAAMPALRRRSGGKAAAFDNAAGFDAIMEALARLDAEAREQFGRDLPPVRKRPAHSAKGRVRGRGWPDDGSGHLLG